MARLKAETATEHKAIEAASNIMSESLSLGEYRAYLEKFYGFQLPLEGVLCGFGLWQALGLPAEERAKLPLLARDLTSLDGGTPASVEICRDLPPLANLAQAVGCAYVLEGSTLGGRIIAKHIQARFADAAPKAFLECYGAETGERWQAFRHAVSRFARTRELEDQVIAGAKATFRAFTAWLERASVVAHP
jgi:heme oxygenase (biliverdin-IX-beta and delta-forming)